MGQRCEAHLTATGPLRQARHARTLGAFQHRVDRLDLPALAVAGAVLDRAVHQPAVITARGLVGRSAVPGRDGGEDAVVVAGIGVIPFAVIAGVTDAMTDRRVRDQFIEHFRQFIHIRPRAASGDQREDQMRSTIDDQAHLGKTLVRGGLPEVWFTRSATHEVSAGAGRVHPRAVGGGQRNHVAPVHLQRYARVQQLPHVRQAQQTLLGLMQGGEMRHLLESDRLADRRHVVQAGLDASVVGLEQPHQDQAGEQLVLGELLGRKLVRIGRQRLLRDLPRSIRHLPW